MLSDLNELPAIKLTDKGDYLRFELDSLTPFGREVAERELRETPEIKKKAIEELRSLLQGKIDFCLYPYDSVIKFDRKKIPKALATFL